MSPPISFSPSMEFGVVRPCFGLGGIIMDAPPRRVLALLFDEVSQVLSELGRVDIIDRVTARARASTLLLALDATLDFALGGSLARELSRAYRGAAVAIEDADDRDLPELCLGIEQLIAELAESWARLD